MVVGLRVWGVGILELRVFLKVFNGFSMVVNWFYLGFLYFSLYAPTQRRFTGLFNAAAGFTCGFRVWMRLCLNPED